MAHAAGADLPAAQQAQRSLHEDAPARARRTACVAAVAVLCAAVFAVCLSSGASRALGSGAALSLRDRQRLELLLQDGGHRAQHIEHARSSLEVAYHEDVRSLRARIHPFGRSRFERGYRDTLNDLNSRLARQHALLERQGAASDIAQLRRLAADKRTSRTSVDTSKVQLDREYRYVMGGLGGSLKDRLTEHDYLGMEGALLRSLRSHGARQEMLVQGPPGQIFVDLGVESATMGAARQAILALHKQLAYARHNGVSKTMQEKGRLAMQALSQQLQCTHMFQRQLIGRLQQQTMGSLKPQALAEDSKLSVALGSMHTLAADHSSRAKAASDQFAKGFREAIRPQHDIISVVSSALMHDEDERAKGTAPNSNATGTNQTRIGIEEIVRDAVSDFAGQNGSLRVNGSALLNRTEIVNAIMARIDEETNETIHPSNVVDLVHTTHRFEVAADPKREFAWIFGRPYAGRGRQHGVAASIFGRRAGENFSATNDTEQRESTTHVMEQTAGALKNMSFAKANLRVSVHDIDWVFGKTMRDYLADKSPAPANGTADAETLKLLIDAARNITGLLNESHRMVDIAKESIMHSFVPDRQIDVDHAQHSMMSVFHPPKTTRITIQVDKGKAKVVDDTAEDEVEERGQRDVAGSNNSASGHSMTTMSKSAKLAHSFADGTKSTSLNGGHMRHIARLKRRHTQLADGGQEEGGENLSEEKDKGEKESSEESELGSGGEDAAAKKEENAIDGWSGLQSFGQWLLIALSLILVIMTMAVCGFICFGCLWAWRECKRQDRWDILFNKVHGAQAGPSKPKPPGTGGGGGAGSRGGGGGGGLPPGREGAGGGGKGGEGGGKGGGGGINKRSDTQMAR